MRMTVDQSFNKAKDALREINNDLFYNELKKNLETTISNLENNYDYITKEIRDLKSSFNNLLRNLEDAFEAMQRNFYDSSQEVLETTGNELEELYESHKEDSGQILDNFYTIQQNFTSINQKMNVQIEEQEGRFNEYLLKQRDAIIRFENQIIEFFKSQNTAYSEQLQELSEMFTDWLRQLEKENQQYFFNITEANRANNSIVTEKILTYQNELEKRMFDFHKSTNRQLDLFHNQLSVIDEKMQVLQYDQKQQSDQFVEILLKNDNEDKKMHKVLLVFGVGIITLQGILIVLQVI